MTFEQQNHLWASLGAKYMPCVMYKVGIMAIQDMQIEAKVPLVEEMNRIYYEDPSQTAFSC